MDKQTLTTLFEAASKENASDVHVTVGAPIMFRVNGELIPKMETDVTQEQSLAIIKGILSDVQMKRFNAEREIDVAYSLDSGTRLRINCHFERGNMGLAARLIPATIPSLGDLDLEDIAKRIFPLENGLVLFTGPTGEGKSSSLAAILQAINESEAVNIITLEDPIEFLFPKRKSVVRQREYGFDFLSFPEALKRVLRQDPDIVMVGEMRDPETIAAALTLAETGHLIFATLHTPNAIQSVDRIIDVFPPHQQGQIRAQLSLSLKMIVAQKLVPKVGGGRVALREVLINSSAVANTIRDGRTPEIISVMQTAEDMGMFTFAKSAERLYKKGSIKKELFQFYSAPAR